MSKALSIGITGGTGTLGQALVTYLLKDSDQEWSRIVVLSRDEVKQAQMAAKIKSLFPHRYDTVRFFIGDVRDRDRVQQAFRGLDAVIHAAALKRIDSVAYNPEEVLKTNVLGTRNVLNAAQDAGVGLVVVVSTDKGVEPTNIYGASKMMAEHLTVAFNAYCIPRGMAASVVRYGNVLGSRGSFLHMWREEVKVRNSVSMTHPQMTRYVLYPLDAVTLIIRHVLSQMKGGEIFVPICSSVRIEDMARTMLHKYGNGGVLWNEMGLRPGGEKIHESLLSQTELDRVCIQEQFSTSLAAESLLQGVMVIPPEIHPWVTKYHIKPTNQAKLIKQVSSSLTQTKLSHAAISQVIDTCMNQIDEEEGDVKRDQAE